MTVAMYAVYADISITEDWYHDPILQDDEGNTVAMHYAIQYGFSGLLELPNHFLHDSSMVNFNGDTVAMLAAKFNSNKTIQTSSLTALVKPW